MLRFMFQNTRFAYLPIALMVLLSACSQFADLEDADRTDHQAEFAVPLVNTSFSMNDLLEDFEENSVLTIEPDGLLRLMYSGDVLTQTTDDVFASINQTLSQAGGIPLTSSSQALPFSFSSGLQVDRMDLKSGSFNWFISNCHDQAITATITLPTVTLDGEPLTVTRQLPAYSGSGNCPSLGNLLSPIDLNGYVVTPVNDSVYVEYYAEDSNGVEVSPSDNTLIGISGLAFSYTEGYLGVYTYEGRRDTILIDFFDNWIQGDVFFEDPIITFNFENSFGVPTRSVIEVFDIFTVREEVLPLQSEFVTNGIDFPYPLLDEIGEVKETQFAFTRDNSNIREVLGAGPIAIDYLVDARTNPDEDTDIRGFVTDSSYYKVRVDVDLPLYGSAIDFTVTDTLSLDFTGFDEIDYAEFKLVTENGMPVSIDMQGYFLDENGNVLDSLLDNQQRVIGGAPVDAIGDPTTTNEVVTFSDFKAERFAKIKPAKELAIVATFFTTTEGEQSVRILADQAVQVKLGAILGVSGE